MYEDAECPRESRTPRGAGTMRRMGEWYIWDGGPAFSHFATLSTVQGSRKYMGLPDRCWAKKCFVVVSDFRSGAVPNVAKNRCGRLHAEAIPRSGRKDQPFCKTATRRTTTIRVEESYIRLVCARSEPPPPPSSWSRGPVCPIGTHAIGTCEHNQMKVN